MMKYIPKSAALCALITTSVLTLPASAQDSLNMVTPPIATESLITTERNYAVLNQQNIAADKFYTVGNPGPDATQFRFKLKGYVFGFRMIKANFTGFFDGSRYGVYTDVKTSGLGAMLKKLEIWAVTGGTYTRASGLMADWHVQQNLDKKNRRVEMNYNHAADNVDVQILPPLWTQGTPPATPAERYNAHDAVSGILSMMMNGPQLDGDVCTGSVPIFDSKQHYNLRMERAGEKRVKFMGDKVDTLRCHVYYEPVSGFDADDLPDEEEGSTPVNVYFYKMDTANMWVPVRFEYKISSIKAVIKLDDYEFVLPERG